MSAGELIQVGTTVYEAENDSAGFRLKPDMCDPYAGYRQVRQALNC